MITLFDQIESQMIGDMHPTFGTGFFLVPMKARPNKRPVRDQSRESFGFCAIMSSPGKLTDLDKNGRIDRAGRKGSMSFNNVSTREHILNVRLCDLLWEPRQHDAVVREIDGRTYEITDITPSGHSDVDLRLSEVEGPYSHVTS